MPYAPWWVGQTWQPLLITWTKDDPARTPVPLPTLTLELWFQSTIDPARKFKGTGTWTNVQSGSAQYTPSATDVAVSDEYDVQGKAYPPGNPSNPYYSDKVHFPVLQPIG